VIGLGAGSGIALMTVMLQIARPEAKPLVEGVLRWGPLFVIILLGMELLHTTMNTWGNKFVDAMTANATASGSNAAALQSMADAMQRISQREDERDRERELVLDHLAYTTQQILSKVESLEARYPEKSLTQVAGGTQ
jgi:ABC-type transport system involved in cytochrome bd biosynthesis fused ATPase/permease subunit